MFGVLLLREGVRRERYLAFRRLYVHLFLWFCFWPQAWAKIQVQRISPERYRVLFIYRPAYPFPKKVYLAGDFNHWNKISHPLRYHPRRGYWSISLELRPGKYRYKFVLDGVKWVFDSEVSEREPDGFGGLNSVFRLRAMVDFSPVKRGDGSVAQQGLEHIPPHSSVYVYQDRTEEGDSILRLRARCGDIQEVYVFLSTGKTFPMEVVWKEGGYCFYEAILPISKPFSYLFLLKDGNSFYYGRRGLSRHRGGYFRFSPERIFRTPLWLRGAVFYQIFPERFANGDSSNDPPGTESWGGEPTYFNFFGGDLEGIERNLSYLKDLGVNGLYLNPIFLSPSSHKYDTQDYFRVDPHFGGNGAFRRLVGALKKARMRLILDGVFNHSGSRFFAFEHLKRYQQRSPYRHWYIVHRFPVVEKKNPDYECWWGFGHLPKLNTAYPAVRQYLLRVAKFWLRQGADGWRLDVPNEVSSDFWRAFRKVTKSVKPDAYLFGEIWQDAQPWLRGDQFDGVMNYRWREAVIDFFARQTLTPTQFCDRLMRQRLTHYQASLYAMYNLLGSHDVERIWTVFDGREDRLRLALVFQFTYPGVPAIYYGDEIGMEGGKDPENRRCFPWRREKWKVGLRDFYRKLIRIRRSTLSLQRGDFRRVLVLDEKGVFVFSRTFRGRTVYVVLHRGEGVVPLELEVCLARGRYMDLLSGRSYVVSGGRVKLELASFQGMILRPF
ncbi:MAG: alpha-glycosidase [Planctomycetota bacterium]|nr:MAG: alpha-glycosidase [Planctomycetota bacterium]